MDKIELAPYTSQSADNLALKCTPTPREEFPPRCAINSTITNCESVAKQCQSTGACARYNARKVNTTCLIFKLCLFCLAIIALTVLGWTICIRHMTGGMLNMTRLHRKHLLPNHHTITTSGISSRTARKKEVASNAVAAKKWRKSARKKKPCIHQKEKGEDSESEPSYLVNTLT